MRVRAGVRAVWPWALLLATLALGMGLRHHAAVSGDGAFERFVGDYVPTPGMDLLRRVTRLGGPRWATFEAVAAGVFLLAVAGLRRAAPRMLLAAAFAPAAALLLAGGTELLLKDLLPRPTPGDPNAMTAGSWPSGHAAVTTAMAVCGLVVLAGLLRRRWPLLFAAPVALALPAVVGFAMAAWRWHWLSDVVGGWMLGTALGVLVARAALTLGGHASAGRPRAG